MPISITTAGIAEAFPCLYGRPLLAVDEGHQIRLMVPRQRPTAAHACVASYSIVVVPKADLIDDAAEELISLLPQLAKVPGTLDRLRALLVADKGSPTEAALRVELAESLVEATKIDVVFERREDTAAALVDE